MTASSQGPPLARTEPFSDQADDADLRFHLGVDSDFAAEIKALIVSEKTTLLPFAPLDACRAADSFAWPPATVPRGVIDSPRTASIGDVTHQGTSQDVKTHAAAGCSAPPPLAGQSATLVDLSQGCKLTRPGRFDVDRSNQETQRGLPSQKEQQGSRVSLSPARPPSPPRSTARFLRHGAGHMQLR